MCGHQCVECARVWLKRVCLQQPLHQFHPAGLAEPLDHRVVGDPVRRHTIRSHHVEDRERLVGQAPYTVRLDHGRVSDDIGRHRSFAILFSDAHFVEQLARGLQVTGAA
uniref:Uncharacterized protein n=1 Tax=Triticum urartu TaxID=4572 RepID=A0A8R7QNR2_TRIUA